MFASGSGQPPAITSQPPNQTVTNGAIVTFSVNATGTPPLGYQWQFNGTNLPGAMNSNLTLTGVTFAQAGFYTAVVTNAAGSALSDPAALSVWCASAPAFSYLTYNVHGNGLTNWSTNMWHVQAIGRQMQYLNPDIITFNEIPVTNNCTAQMVDFVTAFRPGYYLVTNSMDDGFIRSVILSRYPILSSTSWLHGADLAPLRLCRFGFHARFVRGANFRSGFSTAIARVHRAFEIGPGRRFGGQTGGGGGRRFQFFRHGLISPTNSLQPYVLSGDLNEDILRPPPSNPQSLQRLISAPTGLQLATAVNPFTDSELTWSIQDTNMARPCVMITSCRADCCFRTSRAARFSAPICSPIRRRR